MSDRGCIVHGRAPDEMPCPECSSLPTPKLLEVRATHHEAFRSMEWAQLVGIEWRNNRPCFMVRFPDGVTDSWVVYDPGEGYEFRSRVR